MAVAGMALLSCQSEKARTSAALKSFLSEHPYATALADDAPMLMKLNLGVIYDKSGFAEDPEFAALHEAMLEDSDRSERIFIESLIHDLSLTGIDPAQPILLSVSGMEIDIDGDDFREEIYVVAPLEDRAKLLTFINMASEGETTIEPDKDGYYIEIEDNAGVIIAEHAVIAYINTDEDIPAPLMRKRLIAASEKTSLQASRPGIREFFEGKDDIACWVDADAIGAEVRPQLNKLVKENLGKSLEEILGGSITKGVSSFSTLNFAGSDVILHTDVFGTNPLLDRYWSWLGKTDWDLLRHVPSGAVFAGGIAFDNLSDLLNYAQGVLDRSGQADGMNLSAIIAAVGIDPEDLDGVGSLVGGVSISGESFMLAAEAGEGLVEAARNSLMYAGMTPLSEDLYELDDDIRLLLRDDHLFLGSSRLIAAVDKRSASNFLSDNNLSDELTGARGAFVVDLTSEEVYELLDASSEAEILCRYLDSAVLRFFNDRSSELVLHMQEPGRNSAKSLLLMAAELMASSSSNDWDDIDTDVFFEEDEDFDYDYLY